MSPHSFATQETFELAMEASPNGVLVADADGTILLVNSELERQFGYARTELVGQEVGLLVPEALRSIGPTEHERIAETAPGRPAATGRELLGRRKDGASIPVEVHLSLIRGADRAFIFVNVLDHRPRRDEPARLTSVVGQSAAIAQVLKQVEQVARTNATVLLLGETGTGKELFATHIHDLSARRGRTMVRVNCGAIPSALIESELFGREKGAFTGALARQMGRFELADRGTIFLDEIGDLPSEVQVKLLRVLEEGQVERLGSAQPIPIDTRIIAATHRDLEQKITEGTFREDLYYRLNVFPILIPPLRERTEDIPLLVWRFVEDYSNALGKRIEAIDPGSLTALQEHSWPGNVRELRNVVERAMILTTGRRLTIPPPSAPVGVTKTSPRLIDIEKDHIRAVLESTGWRIRGAGGAADRLGLKPTTLETRLARLGLKRPGRG